MSPKMAWAFIDMLSGEHPAGISNNERARLKAKLQLLKYSSEPGDLLRSWLRRRAHLLRLSVARADVNALLKDSRLVPSGISDGRSQLSAGDEVEAYVSPEDIPSIKADYLLAGILPANVWLHVVDRHIPNPAPLGLVLADLAGHNGPREDAILREMLRRGQ